MEKTFGNTEEKGRERLRSGILVLGWVSLLTDVASEMIYPLLPAFLTHTLGAGTAAVGLIEGIAESTASLTKAFSGWWSDRVSRRKPLVVAGYAIAAIARPLVGIATNWGQVLAIRFTDRVGKGIRTAPRDALIADLTPADRRGKAFGLQRAMDNAGGMIGPLIAALLLRFWIHDERTVFLLAVIPGIAGVLLLIARVPEPPKRRPVADTPVRPPTRLPRAFWAALGVFVLFALANSTDAFLLLRARDTGVVVWQLPLLWAFLQGVKAASGVPGGMLSDKIGRTPALALGWLVYALAYVGFALTRAPLATWGLFALYGLFYGLTEGAERALIADIVESSRRGRAFGLFHAALGIAALPASLLFGVWWKIFGAPAAFAIGAALALLAAAGLLLLRKIVRPVREASG